MSRSPDVIVVGGGKRVWSALRPGTPDELPILGPVDGLTGYLNACGHFRTGILNSSLTGLLLAEIASGVPTSFPIKPFLLSRFRSVCQQQDDKRAVPAIREEQPWPQSK